MFHISQLKYFQSGPLLSIVCLITTMFVIFPTNSQSTDEQANSEIGTQVIKSINSPSNTVALLHERLLQVMKNTESLGFEGRYKILDPVITENFDTQLIAKVLLSRIWKALDAQKKDNFIQLFNRLSIATYASRFDAYNNEEFEELAQKQLTKGRLIIETQFIRTNDAPVSFDYLMHQKDGKWYIISVIADSINDLSLKRAEYAAVIKKKGFDGLVKDIESKIYELGNGAER